MGSRKSKNNNNDDDGKKNINERMEKEVEEEEDPSVLLEQQQQQTTTDDTKQQENNGILDLMIDLSLSYLLGPSVHATRSFVVPTVVSQLKQRLLPARWQKNVELKHIPKPSLEDFPFLALQNVILGLWATSTCYESQQLLLDSIGILTSVLEHTTLEGGVWMCHMVDVLASSSAKQTYHDLQTALEEIRTWLVQEPQLLFLQNMTRQFLHILQEEHVHVRQLQKQQQSKRRNQYIAKTYPQQKQKHPEEDLLLDPMMINDDNKNVVHTPPPNNNHEDEEDGLELPPTSVTIPKSPTITDLESLVDSLSPQNSLVNVNYLKETIHHRATIAQELQQHQLQKSPKITPQSSPQQNNNDNDLQYDPSSSPSTAASSHHPNEEERKTKNVPIMIDFLKSVQNDLLQQRKSTCIRKQRRTTTASIYKPPISTSPTTHNGIVKRILHWKLKYQLLLLFVILSMLFIGLLILGLAMYGIYAICFLRSQQSNTNEIILRLYKEQQEHVMVIPTTSPFIHPDEL